MTIQVGTEIDGRYRLRALLQEGGMGAVWRADDLRFPGRPRAIKFCKEPHDSSLRERFLREAQILASIQHPGVVEVFDHGEHDSQLYLVMELLRGEDLAQRLAATQRTSIEFAQQLAIQIGDAVAAVHARGVIHRDLKPSNVFLVEGAGRLQAKVIDFGVARADLFGSDTLTTTDQKIGTWVYMAPEQMLGPTARVDARSDVFALGAILYECLAGERIHGDSNPMQTLARFLRSEPFPPVRSRRPEVGAQLAAVIDRALALDPEQRFADARALCQALRDGPDPALANTLASTPPLPVPKPRARRWLAAMPVALLALGAAWLASTQREHETQAAPFVVQPQPLLSPEPELTQVSKPNSELEQEPVPKPAPTVTEPSLPAPAVKPQPPPRVQLISDPAGAVVRSGDKQLCSDTPCWLTLSGKRLRVEFTLQGYATQSRELTFRDTAQPVNVVLRPEFVRTPSP